MKVITDAGVIEIGTTEAAPTIGLTDYSRRETDDFGVTTVVKRGFSRTMSVRVMVPTANVDALQRQLAALRAKPVQWVADDRFESLSITGFYKDLSIDLAIPPVSYCTLTIEGLAEGADYADPGTDPATDQRKSTLRLLRPASIDDAVLTSSNVPEDDYPAWSASATYALGARVMLSATHRIYESAANGNVGNDPTGVSGQWIDIAPTNRWAMFDQALGSQTERAGSIVVSLDPVAPIDAVALLDVTAVSVRVQAPGYDRTLSPAIQPGAVTFLDLPATAGAVTITISGSGTVSAGTLLIGKLLGLGTTEASPTAAITDYSRKETDAFGEVTVVERAWAKRMDIKALISTAAVDVVAARIANVRAMPALWIGDATLESLAIYGFFKDFAIAVDEHVSTLSLSIEGVSTAAKLAPLITPGDIGFPDGTTLDDLKDQVDVDSGKLETIQPGANVGGTIGVDIKIPEILGIPAPPGLLRNDLLSLGANGVLHYQPYPDNADIKVALGQVAVPDVPGQLALQPDGTLQFETADGAVTVLGRIRLPDLGAGSDTSRRTLETAMDQISATVARVASEANRTRETFRDAGFYADPATGEVRISAVDQTREQVSEAYIRLSAAESLIALSATRTYVNNAIAVAVLDPSQVPVFQGLEVRITSAELRLDGAEASLALKADVIEVTDLSARVTTAQESIDALAGQISLKVDSVEFDAVVARVASAEQVIDALGDTASITQALTAVRMLPAAAADAQESALRAILAGDAARRFQVASLASARTELTAKINEDGSAQARARDELAARVGAAEAYALQETQVRASETQAIAIQVSQLSTQFNDSRATFTAQIATLASETEALAARSQALEVGVGENTAAIEAEQAARIAEDGTIRASATEAVTAARGLTSRVDTMMDLVIRELLQGDARSRQLSGAIAASRQEITAKINGDVEAVVARVSLLLARMDKAEAAIVIEEIARATQYEAVARQITTLSATIDGANATFTQQIAALVTGAQAATQRMDSMQSAIGNNASAIENEASTRAEVDGRIEAAARQTVAAVRGVDGSAAAAAEQALRALLTGDAAKRDAKGAIAATRQEVTARVTADLEVMVQRINVLLARLGMAEASIALEQFTTATALAAIAKQIETLSASIQGDLGQLSASLETIKQASVDRDSALAAQVTDLKVEKDDDVAELAASVQQANQARIDGDAAQAASTEALRAEKNDDVADIRAQANVDRQATIDGDTAVAALVDVLRVEKDGDIGALSAELVEERQARIDENGALAADVDTVRATVNGHTAEIEQQSAVLIDLEGRTAIKFRIAATDPDGTTYVEIARQNGTGKIVLGGDTEILGDIITPGTITAREIEAAGVSRAYDASNANAFTATTTMTDVVAITVVMDRPGTIMLHAAYQLTVGSGGSWSAAIAVGTNVLQTGSGAANNNYAGFMRSTQVPAGTYVCKVRLAGSGTTINAGGCSLLVLRTYV
ncbi:coiled-coil domain-containing protein [Sphingobium naphthae]|uniref:DUF1983 domain-containing protein n=1 Tax=Sphingobium naphthae TaxID=1886786 RepID=A0ABU3ZUA0_9SPHN|nr:hypothetical protein [Sphingobium naphthae]MDV5823102.1 hypothetical protein [Sphingobium naphthae]